MYKFIKTYYVLLILAVFFVAMMVLNCKGFCHDKMRFLSDDEKIRIVVTDILERYGQKIAFESSGSGSSIKSNKWILGPGTVEKPDSVFEQKAFPAYPIPYRDIDEFFAVNPKCCYVTKHYQSIDPEDGDRVNSFCLFGSKSAIVVVKYNFRYKDENGLLKSENLVRFIGMNNCGKFIYDV